MAASRDYTVVRYGTDSSGRGIWMTRWMTLVFQAILRHPDVAPFAWKVTIVQGAFMVREGGGAVDSAGYHDQGGCIDLRTWNLTTAELNILVRVFRMFGFALWRRDETARHGGMDPHAHGTLGSDSPLSSGAKVSWSSYVGNGDGLAGPGSDYEWRPSPLVLTPPAHLLQEDFMATSAAERKLNTIIEQNKKLIDLAETEATVDQKRWAAERERDRKAVQKARDSKSQLVSAVGGVMDQLVELSNKIDDPVVKEQARAAFATLQTALADDPDVDGADNPVVEA